jgi:hypothetical protein
VRRVIALKHKNMLCSPSGCWATRRRRHCQAGWLPALREAYIAHLCLFYVHVPLQRCHLHQQYVVHQQAAIIRFILFFLSLSHCGFAAQPVDCLKCDWIGVLSVTCSSETVIYNYASSNWVHVQHACLPGSAL